MRRRGFLAAFGVSLAAASSGCAGGGDDESPTAPESDVRFDSDRRLGAGPDASVSVSPEGDYEYLSESDSVRFQQDSGETDTEPFDEWAAERAVDPAVERVDTRLFEASISSGQVRVGLGGDLDGLDLPETVAEKAPEPPFPLPLVNYVHHYSREGELISKPEVPFEEVVDATPRTVAVTVSIPEATSETTLPVVCQRFGMQND